MVKEGDRKGDREGGGGEGRWSDVEKEKEAKSRSRGGEEREGIGDKKEG